VVAGSAVVVVVGCVDVVVVMSTDDSEHATSNSASANREVRTRNLRFIGMNETASNEGIRGFAAGYL